MKNTFASLLFCIMLVIGFMSAQQNIDFSGNWILSKERSKFQLKFFEKLEKAVVYIEHDEPLFRFTRVFTSEGQDNSLTYELTTDGKEKITQEGNQKYISQLYWEGETLIFFTRIESPQCEATNTVRYRLLNNGRTFQAEESFRGPRLKYDNLWVFEMEK